MIFDRRSSAVTLLAFLCPLFVAGGPAHAQTLPFSAAEARAEFSRVARTGGYWATSNAAYVQNGGEPDEYRMAFALAPDGYSITGCMWGDPAPENVRPFWRFFHAWDPTENAILAYQSSPSGAVAMGYQLRWQEGGTETIQGLHVPGADPLDVRHLSRAPHPDTLDSRSFQRPPYTGEWTARRSYVWIWRPSAEPVPC